ncbi:MAG: radical SAM protein [Gammaproteobacteria bacterium]|nr:radical SAM protein [Gammaproteobacteria bacterium]
MFNYDSPLYRPPSEGNNLIIQATLGCSFNRCTFCSMYRSKTYRARPLEEVFADLQDAASAWPDARRIFLADGDALALPTEHLMKILERVKRLFPAFSRVSSYATPSNLRRKTVEELTELREQGLKLVYLGIESGSDLILKKITKGANRRSTGDAMIKADQAGLKVSGTVILGLGGRQHWETHIDGTLALLSEAPLTYLSTLQLHLEREIREEFYHKFGEPFQMQDDRRILLEQERLIEGLQPPAPVIFRSNHASNALALAGNLPRDRDRLLQQIQAVLGGAPGIRPAFLRGL